MLGKVEICGVNTTKLPTLTAAETDALLHRAKDGDAAAREKLVEGNLRLVLSVIQRFSGRGENADDLFQVGCVGLLKAIDNFDTSQNVRFSTYGVPMIIGEIRRYLRDNSSIRVSRSMRDTAYRVLQAREKLQREQQREPTVEQIARELGIRREEVVFAMDAVCDPVSLFEPIYSDGGDAVCVMDQVRDTRNTDESWLDRIALREAVDKLSPREQRILAMRFYDGKTQMEVSSEIGISQAQVSRLEKSAIRSIRNRRAEMNVPPSRKAHLFITTDRQDAFRSGEIYITKLAYAEQITISSEQPADAEKMVSAVTEEAKLFMPMAELIDLDKERARLEKELEKARKNYEGQMRKLSNENFISRAPEAVVQTERERAEKARALVENLEASLKNLG